MTNSAFPTLDGASRSAAEASLEFGRFRVRLRQRQLLADGLPIELGTRAFELLLTLLEANGSLVSKEQLLARVWPGVAVADANVKVHVCALRKALGEDREFIRTEFGRGYRFIAAVHSTVAWSRRQRPLRWRHESTLELLPRRTDWRPSHGRSADCLARHFDLAPGAGARSPVCGQVALTDPADVTVSPEAAKPWPPIGSDRRSVKCPASPKGPAV